GNSRQSTRQAKSGPCDLELRRVRRNSKPQTWLFHGPRKFLLFSPFFAAVNHEIVTLFTLNGCQITPCPFTVRHPLFFHQPLFFRAQELFDDIAPRPYSLAQYILGNIEPHLTSDERNVSVKPHPTALSVPSNLRLTKPGAPVKPRLTEPSVSTKLHHAESCIPSKPHLTELSVLIKFRYLEPGAPVKPRLTEPGVSTKLRLTEPGVPVEPRLTEPGISTKPRLVKPSIAAKQRLIEQSVSAELRPVEEGGVNLATAEVEVQQSGTGEIEVNVLPVPILLSLLGPEVVGQDALGGQPDFAFLLAPLVLLPVFFSRIVHGRGVGHPQVRAQHVGDGLLLLRRV